MLVLWQLGVLALETRYVLQYSILLSAHQVLQFRIYKEIPQIDVLVLYGAYVVGR